MRVVKILTIHLRDEYHNSFYHNFFTSLKLLDLEEYGLYECGTAHKHHIKFLPTLKTMKLTNRYHTFKLIAQIFFSILLPMTVVIFTWNNNGITLESSIEYTTVLGYWDFLFYLKILSTGWSALWLL